jgi:hypothetical protein
MDVERCIDEIWRSKQREAGCARLQALHDHPGLCIEGQVYDMQQIEYTGAIS